MPKIGAGRKAASKAKAASSATQRRATRQAAAASPAVKQRAESLKDLAARGGRGQAGYPEVNAGLSALEKRPRAEVEAVGREMGIVGAFRSKRDALEKITQRVRGPLDARARTDF